MPKKKKSGKKSDTKKSAKLNASEVPVLPKLMDSTVAYVRLRTIIDAVEMGGLRYANAATTDEERIERLTSLAAKLAPIEKSIRKLNLKSPEPANRAMKVASGENDTDPDADVSCPDGYYPCNGNCVPYPCR